MVDEMVARLVCHWELQRAEKMVAAMAVEYAEM
jgi:hypothetical protein